MTRHVHAFITDSRTLFRMLLLGRLKTVKHFVCRNVKPGNVRAL